MLDLFHLQPDKFIKDLDDLVMFIAQIAHCFPVELAEFPQKLITILKTHHMVLHPEMRLVW